jgi:hypothetical protein
LLTLPPCPNLSPHWASTRIQFEPGADLLTMSPRQTTLKSAHRKESEGDMTQGKPTYQWSNRDKFLYFIILIPFLAAFVGAAYLLATVSICLTIMFLSLYVITNFFQAGCCIRCPYRGRYCPATFGIYLSNLFSATIYAKRSFEPRFFRINATLAETSLIITLLFPIYWLALLNWYYLAIFLTLLVVHMALFFPIMCPKCSYSNTCPGGQVVHRLSRR